MKHLRVCSLAALAGAALPLLAGCGTSGSGGLEALNGTPMPYSVVVTGSWPDTQIQGSPVELQMRAQNIGSPVPHLVMVFDGLVPTWTAGRASGCGHPAVKLKAVGADPAFDFGPLQKGQICDYTVNVRRSVVDVRQGLRAAVRRGDLRKGRDAEFPSTAVWSW